MAFQTIDIDGRPWMVCDPESSTEAHEVAEQCGHDLSKVEVRAATPAEEAKLVTERMLAEREGRDPFKVFGTQL